MRRFATPAGPRPDGNQRRVRFQRPRRPRLRWPPRQQPLRRWPAHRRGPASALGQLRCRARRPCAARARGLGLRRRNGDSSSGSGGFGGTARFPKVIASSILESGLYPLCAAKRYPAWEARSHKRQPVFGKALRIQVKSELTSRKTRRASPRRASASVRQVSGCPGNFLEHDPEKLSRFRKGLSPRVRRECGDHAPPII
jgi:hypothetical protein